MLKSQRLGFCPEGGIWWFPHSLCDSKNTAKTHSLACVYYRKELQLAGRGLLYSAIFLFDWMGSVRLWYCVQDSNWVNDPQTQGVQLTAIGATWIQNVNFNPLTLELDIYSLAHHLCKM